MGCVKANLSNTPGQVIDEGLIQLQTKIYFVCNKRKKASLA